MQNLKDLSKYYKTNKYELGYIDICEKYFENIKDKKLNILKIGIDRGPSLRVWSDYFVNSKFAGKINNINFFQNCVVIRKGSSKKFFYKNIIQDTFLEKIKKYLSKIYA